MNEAAAQPIPPSLLELLRHTHAFYGLYNSRAAAALLQPASERVQAALAAMDVAALRFGPCTAPVSYASIFNGAAFTVCLFVLQPGASMPIHDHPGMTVFTRVLAGGLGVQQYSLGAHVGDDAGGAAVFAASRATRRTVRAGLGQDALVLAPEQGGTLHSFTALEDGGGAAVILDVLGPPYDTAAGRPCSYFRELGGGEAARLGFAVDSGNDACFLLRDPAIQDSYKSQSVSLTVA